MSSSSSSSSTNNPLVDEEVGSEGDSPTADATGTGVPSLAVPIQHNIFNNSTAINPRTPHPSSSSSSSGENAAAGEGPPEAEADPKITIEEMNIITDGTQLLEFLGNLPIGRNVHKGNYDEQSFERIKK